MRTLDFDYDLPLRLIAQKPVEPRDASRMLVLHRASDRIGHCVFADIGSYLNPGDLLVVNRTRVIPARIYARKPTGGQVEILLLHANQEREWECIVGGKRIKKGLRLKVEGADLETEVVEVLEGARRVLRFSKAVDLYLPRIGHVPLPPYIHEKLDNPERYQTIYARESGSAAAPTAGLHFTPRLMKRLQEQGVGFAEIILRVGLDTFLPVVEKNPRKHKIHSEWCHLPLETAQAINQTREYGGRIIAVGTTSVRTLESAARKVGVDGEEYCVQPFTGLTDLFILPGYQFRIVDVMLTNFHLPCSTLIMLVSAFAGRERILRAYQEAIEKNYRFYSFGDAMLII